jgi:phosphopantothenoylcysteine synthetase/decarboxylase
MREKNCDAIVLNGPTAIGSPDNEINLLDKTGKIALHCAGKKRDVAEQILVWIDRELAR